MNLIAKTFKKHEDLEPKKLFSTLSNDPVFSKSIEDAFDFPKEFVFFAVGESASIGEVVRAMVATGDKQHRRALVFAEGKPHDPAKSVFFFFFFLSFRHSMMMSLFLAWFPWFPSGLSST